MIKKFYFKQFRLAWVRSLDVKTILFQIIQLIISTQFSFIWPIYRTLSGATTLDQRGLWSNDNKGVLRIPQSSYIIKASTSDCLVSYPEHFLAYSYTSVEMLSVYSAALTDRATLNLWFWRWALRSTSGPEKILKVGFSAANDVPTNKRNLLL